MKKTTKILYWCFTGLFAFFMFGSAIPDILSVQMAQEGFKSIELPVTLLPFLGWAKTLGVVAILYTPYKTLTEWAYAGLFYDLIGAFYCILAAGKPFADAAGILLPLVIGVFSYIYFRKTKIA